MASRNFAWACLGFSLGEVDLRDHAERFRILVARLENVLQSVLRAIVVLVRERVLGDAAPGRIEVGRFLHDLVESPVALVRLSEEAVEVDDAYLHARANRSFLGGDVEFLLRAGRLPFREIERTEREVRVRGIRARR